MIAPIPPTVDRVRAAAQGWISGQPISYAELAARVSGALGQVIDADVIEAVLDESMTAWPIDDERVVDLHHAFEGWTFSHFVTAAEALAGELVVVPDLALMVSLADGAGEDADLANHRLGLPSVDSPSVDAAYRPRLVHPSVSLEWHRGWDDDDAPPWMGFADERIVTIAGPSGWLAGFEGRRIGFTRSGGEWRWAGAIDTDGDSADLRRIALTALRAIVAEDRVRGFADALDGALAEAAFADPEHVPFGGVVAPLGELLTEAGASMRGDLIGKIGTDWVARETRQIAQQLSASWKVPAATIEDATMIITGAMTFAVSGAEFRALLAESDLANFVRKIARADVAVIVASGYLPEAAPSMVEAFLAFLAERATGRAAGAIAWVRSHLVDDPVRTEALRAESERLDRRFLPLLDDRLWHAACRGTAPEVIAAFEAWTSAGGMSRSEMQVDSEPDPMQMLRLFVAHAYRPTPVRRRADAGRNEPCPCGSGQKYKRCHLGRPLSVETPETAAVVFDDRPDSDRLIAMQALQHLYLDRRDPRTVPRLAQGLQGHIGEGQESTVVGFLLDAMTADHETTESFLAEVHRHGASWTAAEIDLVRRWTASRHSLFEVIDASPGVRMTVRDVRSGDRLVVDAPQSSRTLAIHDYVLTRVIANSTGWQFGQGVLGVALQDRDTTLAFLDECGDRVTERDLHAWITGWRGRATRPYERREMRNTDDDVMVHHFGRFRLLAATDPDALVRAIDTAPNLERTDDLDSDSDGARLSPVWHVYGPDDPNRFIRGTVRVHVDEVDRSDAVIDITANSVVRYRRARELVEAAVGALAVEAETIDDQYDIALAAELGWSNDAITSPTANSPTLSAEAIAEIRNELADRWLQTSIPALQGLTPRQAADDATRRDDLRRLLISMSDLAVPAPFAGQGNFIAGPDASVLAKALGIDLPRPIRSLLQLPGRPTATGRS